MVSKITKYRLTGTTDASGDATVYTNSVVRGKIRNVQLDIDGLDAGADTTITTADELVAQTIIGLTNSNTNATINPSTSAQDTAGVNLVYAAAGEIVPTEFTVFSRLKCVVAQGGNTKAFAVDVTVEEY